MIYGLLDSKFNALSDWIQSVARLFPDIVMFKRSRNDSQSLCDMIAVSFVMGELTDILFDLK